MEAVSEYPIEPGMTFQADTFFYDDDLGCRWENGLLVSESGPATMINEGRHMEIVEISIRPHEDHQAITCRPRRIPAGS